MDNLFFFSSRRRHTRYWRDWSSDVCSSDLRQHLFLDLLDRRGEGLCRSVGELERHLLRVARVHPDEALLDLLRSEERRVGKERRAQWVECHLKRRMRQEKHLTESNTRGWKS